MQFGDAIFICVGTPPLPNGDVDLSALDSVARLIGLESRSSKLVVEKSTVPLQTGNMLMRALSTYGQKSEHRFRVVYSNPEFLREGSAIRDFMHPDRIVIGVNDESAESQLRDIYRPIVDCDFVCPVHEGYCPSVPIPPLIVTSVNSAELIKHACNSFLALKISYANLISGAAPKVCAPTWMKWFVQWRLTRESGRHSLVRGWALEATVCQRTCKRSFALARMQALRCRC